MTGAAPSVRDLLAGPSLAGARLAGGAAGLDRGVLSVVVASRVDRADVAPGAAVLLVAASTSLDADVALRHAADRGAALVLLPEAIVGPSTARIADRLSIPAVVHAAADAHALAGALDAAVRAPQLQAAELCLAVARAVLAAGADPQRAVPALATALALPVTIVDAEGAEITAGGAPPRLVSPRAFSPASRAPCPTPPAAGSSLRPRSCSPRRPRRGSSPGRRGSGRGGRWRWPRRSRSRVPDSPACSPGGGWRSSATRASVPACSRS